MYYICGFTKEFIALCSLFGRTYTWPNYLQSIKFGANMCKNGPLMAKSVIFNMAAAAILDFEKNECTVTGILFIMMLW